MNALLSFGGEYRSTGEGDRLSTLMHSMATPHRFNNRNNKARFLSTGFNKTYRAQAARTKNKADASSVMKLMLNRSSFAVIFWAVAVASPNTTS